MIRNNVTRMLDAKKIQFIAHELPEEKIGAFEAANYLGVAPELVYKTIVVVRTVPGKPLLVILPAVMEVDLKLVASALGEKKVLLPSQREAERLTGLQAGGISALALIQRGFQVLIDQSALIHQQIFVSGGQRGLNIQLSPHDLAALTNARFASLGKSTTAQ